MKQQDSQTAFLVISVLHNIAQKNRTTVVLTIHQPSARLLNMLSQVIILSGGCTVFSGPPSDLKPYFESVCGGPANYPCNGLEYALDVINDMTDKANPKEGCRALIEIYRKRHDVDHSDNDSDDSSDDDNNNNNNNSNYNSDNINNHNNHNNNNNNSNVIIHNSNNNSNNNNNNNSEFDVEEQKHGKVVEALWNEGPRRVTVVRFQQPSGPAHGGFRRSTSSESNDLSMMINQRSDHDQTERFKRHSVGTWSMTKFRYVNTIW